MMKNPSSEEEKKLDITEIFRLKNKATTTTTKTK